LFWWSRVESVKRGVSVAGMVDVIVGRKRIAAGRVGIST